MKALVIKIVILAVILIFSSSSYSQIGISNDSLSPDPSAMLDINSTSKGLLVPRMTQSQMSQIIAPANGLLVYCRTDDKFYAYLASANVWKEILYGAGTVIPATVPSISSSIVTSITNTTAISGGSIATDGGAPITAYGVCWSTSPNPTVADYYTNDGSGQGVFVSNLTGLTANTPYYLRAYATNMMGTAYGNEVSFTTLPLSIGQYYQGGYVFYIDSTGRSGLIAATVDQGNAAHNCSLYSLERTFVGSGFQNTYEMVNNCSGEAGLICYNLILNNYEDWFMPSKDELNLMYLNLKVNGIGGFSNSSYGSSSYFFGGDSFKSWSQNFINGSQSRTPNSSQFRVRAVRSFGPESKPSILNSKINTNSTSSIVTVSFNPNGFNTTVSFEYGTTSTYGNSVILESVPIIGHSVIQISTLIEELTMNTTYHYRVKAENEFGATYSVDKSFISFYGVGESYGGGTIFYVDSTFIHGMVTTSAVLDAVHWGCDGMDIPGASGIIIGTGSQNTIDIVNNCPDSTCAAHICNNLNLNGYTDWFLPSKDELLTLLINLYPSSYSAYQGPDLWTSSEIDSHWVWANFVIGTPLIGMRTFVKTEDSQMYPVGIHAVRVY